MIISHEHKYLFIATPHTGSTAISRELCENYDGRKILRKHSNYIEFERVASEKEKQFFIFAGVRNPLDFATSFYLKHLTNHRSIFTNQKLRLKSGGWVTEKSIKLFKFIQENQTNFSEFLKKLYPIPIPFSSTINLNKPHCDYIIRFENINEDFSEVLKLLNLKQVRPLPLINVTKKKKDFLDYYNDDILKYAIKIFGPFMNEWGYKFPESWSNSKINPFNVMKYELAKIIKSYYYKYVESGFLRKGKQIVGKFL